MDYRYIRLDGMPLTDAQWFENCNWDNFDKGDTVFVQDNDEIAADEVYYIAHTDAIVFLTGKKI